MSPLNKWAAADCKTNSAVVNVIVDQCYIDSKQTPFQIEIDTPTLKWPSDWLLDTQALMYPQMYYMRYFKLLNFTFGPSHSSIAKTS